MLLSPSQRDHTVIRLSFEPYIATGTTGTEQQPGTSLPFHDKLTAREAVRIYCQITGSTTGSEVPCTNPSRTSLHPSQVTFGNRVYDTQRTTILPNAPKHLSSRAPNSRLDYLPATSRQTPLCPLSNKSFRNRSSRDSVSSVRRPHQFRRRIPTETHDAQQRRCCTACPEWQRERWPSGRDTSLPTHELWEPQHPEWAGAAAEWGRSVAGR